MSGTAYEWRGVNRRGEAICGGGTATPAELAAIVEDRYKTGWRWLKVERHGVPVAAIERNLDTGTRSWWADTGFDPTPVPPVPEEG